MQSIKRALLSVSDKKGLVSLASQLQALNIEIYSTGGTSRELKEAGIHHHLVEELTGHPEILNGRVKTLHPKLHGGILAERNHHQEEMKTHGIKPIDLVIVNFYPFHQVIHQNDLSISKVIEEIDIGGPTLVRGAAKNMAWVGVVVDPNDYETLIKHLKAEGTLPLSFREYLALKAFKLTSDYDAMVSGYLAKRFNAEQRIDETLHLKESIALRYGENPHQTAKAFQLIGEEGILSANVHQGKVLSYNNLLDANHALTCLSEFEKPSCVIVKHGSPCGVAERDAIIDAFKTAYLADSQSAFGGIVALNKVCTEELAKLIVEHFFEVVIAPNFSDEALAILKSKPNLRVLSLPVQNFINQWEYTFIQGGVLKQEKNTHQLTEADLKIVTKQTLKEAQIADLLFAWRVVKHIKSNAILVAKDKCTLGIGGGQVSRIDAVDFAINKAGKDLTGSVLASDAYFPFRDSIDRIANTGITAIIQPGGSIKDQEVINACDEYGIAMVFTGNRCFKH